jgi:hypothetical protein
MCELSMLLSSSEQNKFRVPTKDVAAYKSCLHSRFIVVCIITRPTKDVAA